MDTYYIPFSPKKITGLRQPARGKLWSRFMNVRAALRMAESHREKPHSKPNEKEPEINVLDIPHLTFLKTAIEPYPKIVEAWESTCSIRKELYKDSNLEEIFNDFPVLKTAQGIELVSYKFIYPVFSSLDLQ